MNKALTQYQKILSGEARPRFKAAPLTDKVERGLACLTECHLCSRECRVDRTAGETGYCKVGSQISISSCFDHLGEEYFLVPSFTIFFNSCTFACEYCQNWEISQVDHVDETQNLRPADLARAIDHHNYCKNVNFVGGDPTPYLPFILQTLMMVRADIPVVWNSNFYMSETSMELLAGIVDVYLSDFKYGNDDCATRLSDAPGYSEIIRRNHKLALGDAEVVIRHLILPNHLECCTRPILDHIAKHFGDQVVVNLMDQYRPCYRADQHPDLIRRITRREFDDAVAYAVKLGVNFIT